ncbi:MAG: hypothetical protein ACI9FN_002466, partial [Saprospiraceae bacterium]
MKKHTIDLILLLRDKMLRNGSFQYREGRLKSFFLFGAFLISGVLLNAQTVKGVITDNEGSPLIGANVLVKGTNTGTISDLDGSYSIG